MSQRKEKKKKKKEKKIDRDIQRRRAWRREALQERYGEKKTSQSEQADCGVYILRIYICICVFIYRIFPLLEVCQ